MLVVLLGAEALVLLVAGLRIVKKSVRRAHLRWVVCYRVGKRRVKYVGGVCVDTVSRPFM